MDGIKITEVWLSIKPSFAEITLFISLFDTSGRIHSFLYYFPSGLKQYPIGHLNLESISKVGIIVFYFSRLLYIISRPPFSEGKLKTAMHLTQKSLLLYIIPNVLLRYYDLSK